MTVEGILWKQENCELQVVEEVKDFLQALKMMTTSMKRMYTIVG